MRSRTVAAILACAVLVVALVACQDDGPEQLNVFQEAKLAEPSAMTIKRWVRTDAEGTPQADQLELAAVVTGGELLEEILSLLDQPLSVDTGGECEAEFLLDFNVGLRSERMSYRCGDDGLFLWGSQAYWRGGRVAMPSAFDELIQSAVAP